MRTSNVASVLSRFLLVLLSVLPLLASAPVRADDQQEARSSFERGVEASREQRWEEARASFKRSLALMPKASTMFNLAVAEVKLGLGRDALERLDAFERAASPKEHAAMLDRARVLRPQAQALVDSEKAKAEHRGNVLSRTDDGLSDQARSDVIVGRENYARGNDREALAAFERAYRASKRPELLYNIGVVADRLREDTRAMSAYERFVGALPDAPEAAVAQVRSEALRAAIEERERNRGNDRDEPSRRAPHDDHDDESASVPKPVAPPPSLALPRTLIALGGLMVGGAVGAVFGILDAKDALDECSDLAAKGGEKQCKNVSKTEATNHKNLWTGVTVGAGVVAAGLITTGAVLLVQRKQGSERASLLTPWFAQRAAGLSLTATF